MSSELEALIVRFAIENPRQGYDKIHGELLKLGHRLGVISVRNILKRHRVIPVSQLSTGSWCNFLVHYKDQILAYDFFTVETVWLKTIYVLFFIELGTLRTYLAGYMINPDITWATQQARTMGMSEDYIVHFRREALLHDMGKLGVPDDILFNPAALTEEEWAIIKQHPQFVFDMLSLIAYLRPALDIPYCHHEKWYGTGYPRGLKGEQIPLAARVFAMVDVWDAQTSDRPYRKAWSKEKAIHYILDESGKYFDPRAVEVFMELSQKLGI